MGLFSGKISSQNIWLLLLNISDRSYNMDKGALSFSAASIYVFHARLSTTYSLHSRYGCFDCNSCDWGLSIQPSIICRGGISFSHGYGIFDWSQLLMFYWLLLWPIPSQLILWCLLYGNATWISNEFHGITMVCYHENIIWLLWISRISHKTYTRICISMLEGFTFRWIQVIYLRIYFRVSSLELGG